TLGSGHGQFAALRILLNAGRGERTGGVGQHCPDRLNEALPVAQRYPEPLEIALCQLRQHIAVDCVLDEALGVPFQADRCEPLGNAFHGTSRRLRAMGRSNTIRSVLLTVIMYLRARSDWKAINSVSGATANSAQDATRAKDLSKLPRIRKQRLHLDLDKGRRGQGFLPAGSAASRRSISARLICGRYCIFSPKH